MNELQATLDQAFNLICDIMVRGCDAEKMADAKNCIRKAFQLAGEKEESNNGGQNDRRTETSSATSGHKSDPS